MSMPPRARITQAQEELNTFLPQRRIQQRYSKHTVRMMLTASFFLAIVRRSTRMRPIPRRYRLLDEKPFHAYMHGGIHMARPIGHPLIGISPAREEMKMFKHKLATVFAVLNLSCLAGVQAAPQPDVVTNGNLWSITFFDDSSPVHTQWATQRLCFFITGTVGTQLAGVWYSPTFFDWNGTWRQEGDQVFMTGDYAGDVNGNAVGHDGVEWQLVTAEKSSEGFGHWKEWRENGRFGQPIGYGNAKLSRLGSCNPVILDTRDTETVEKLVAEESLKAPRRIRKDGSEAVGPFDADQLPLQ